MESLAEAVKPLAERIAERAAAARSRHPEIVVRADQVARVMAYRPSMVCPQCNGMGTHCPVCHGFGLVCPACSGARTVKRGGLEVRADDRLMSCPTCTRPGGEYDLEREQRAIGEMFERMRRAEQRRLDDDVPF